MTKYTGITAIDNYALILAYNNFHRKKPVNMAIFNKRTKLDDVSIIEATKKASDIIATLEAKEKEYQDELKKNAELIQEKPQIPEEILKEAKKIYESGEFIGYCAETWRKIWYKDEQILKFILISAANKLITNSDEGLHIHVAGKTQTGKSRCVETALPFTKKEMQITQTFSEKWIFYASRTGELVGKQFLFSDDTRFSEEMAELYRNILSSWATGVHRGTVNTNREAETLYIPPRITLILTAVDTVSKLSDDGQDESRFLTLEIRRTHEDEERIKEIMQQEKPDISHEMEIISAVWELIPEIEVKIPFLFKTSLTLREFNKFMAVVRASALLHNRVIASSDDVKFANELFTYCRQMIRGDISGFTRNEKALIQLLNENCGNGGRYLTTADISKECNIPNSSVYSALRGKNGSFEKPNGGLVTKNVSIDIRRNQLGQTEIKLLEKVDLNTTSYSHTSIQEPQTTYSAFEEKASA